MVKNMALGVCVYKSVTEAKRSREQYVRRLELVNQQLYDRKSTEKTTTTNELHFKTRPGPSNYRKRSSKTYVWICIYYFDFDFDFEVFSLSG